MFTIAIVMIIIFLAGVIYYFLSAGNKTQEVEKAKNLEEEITKLKTRLANLSATENVDEKVMLANDCVKLGLHKEAIPIYSSCLAGGDENNPQIRLALANALYTIGSYNETRTALIQLQSDRTSYKPNQIRFLSAKNAEALGELDNALYEYGQLSDILIGEEARLRHGLLLKKMGKAEEAKKIFKLILERANHADSYYRDEQQEWIKLAKENLK